MFCSVDETGKAAVTVYRGPSYDGGRGAAMRHARHGAGRIDVMLPTNAIRRQIIQPVRLDLDYRILPKGYTGQRRGASAGLVTCVALPSFLLTLACRLPFAESEGAAVATGRRQGHS